MPNWPLTSADWNTREAIRNNYDRVRNIRPMRWVEFARPPYGRVVYFQRIHIGEHREPAFTINGMRQMVAYGPTGIRQYSDKYGPGLGYAIPYEEFQRQAALLGDFDAKLEALRIHLHRKIDDYARKIA